MIRKIGSSEARVVANKPNLLEKLRCAAKSNRKLWPDEFKRLEDAEQGKTWSKD